MSRAVRSPVASFMKFKERHGHTVTVNEDKVEGWEKVHASINHKGASPSRMDIGKVSVSTMGTKNTVVLSL